MILGRFIEEFIEPNSLIRLVYKGIGGHRLVLKDWDDVSMEWQIHKGIGKNRHFINNEVISIACIHVRGHYSEAINICIEELENQPCIEEEKKHSCACGHLQEGETKMQSKVGTYTKPPLPPPPAEKSDIINCPDCGAMVNYEDGKPKRKVV